MKRNLTFLWLVLTLISLSSCFDIVDEMSLREDGSGEFTLTLNMSKSKSRLASIMLLESFKDYKVPSQQEIVDFIDEIVVFLENAEGINNVKRTTDFTEFIFTLDFSFQSVEHINQAINDLSVKIGGQSESLSLRYSYDANKRIFSRQYTPNQADQKNYEKLDSEDRNMFSTAVYISICRFEQIVNNCSNKKARISKSGKAVLLRTNAVDILKGNSNLTYTVELD